MSAYPALMAGLLWAALATQTASAELALVHEFERNLGLFGISANGELLVFEQPLAEKSGCRLQPCDPYLHQIVVRNAATRQTISHIKVAFEGFRKVTIAFVPGREDILLRGRVPARKEDARTFFLWSPRTQAITELPLPAGHANLEFVRTLDDVRVLGTTGTSIVIWNRATNDITPVPEDSVTRIFAAGFFRKPVQDRLRSMVPDDASEIVHGHALSSDGKLLVIVSSTWRSSTFPADPVMTRFYLSAYDLSGERRLLRTRLFDEESRRGELIDHIATKVAISPEGNAVAFSYERQTDAFGYRRANRQPRFAVYGIPSGKHLGTVSHPAESVSQSVAAVVPAASGVLQFSPDNRYLYTTTRDTHCWKLP